MMKKLLATIVVAILMCSISAVAVGLLKPTMQVTVQGGVYTIEVSGLTRTQSQQLEKLINNYLDEKENPLAIVYLVRNNKLYCIENGQEHYQEHYIDTVCSGEIGVDKYNNVIYINEDYEAMYINTNDPTRTKKITSSAKNLEVSGNVVTGVNYAGETTSSFINDAGNDLPVVIYEQAGSQLRVKKSGEDIRVSSSIATKADNPIAVTASGSLVYVTSTGYVYEIENLEYLTKVKSTTPKRLSLGRIVDLNIDNGSAKAYVSSNGQIKEILN